MKTFLRIGSVAIWALSIFCVIGWWFFSWVGSAFDWCGSKILERYLSSDATREVVVFSVDCGATSSGENYQIALVHPGEERPDKNGKIFFIGDPGTYDVIAPEVEWESFESIRVYFSGSINLYKLELRVENININYGPRANRNK
jgi:hypothetical protein